MTTADARTKYAHEVVPEPAEDAPLVEHTRYHLARAVGFWQRFMSSMDRRGDREAILLALQSATYALTLVALNDGLAGDEAYRWAADRCHDGDAGEWLWECGTKLGVDVSAIKGYDLPSTPDGDV